MDEKRNPAGRYSENARLLARKGSAEPLLRNASRLELVEDMPEERATERADDRHLTDAVAQATAALLTADPRKAGRKPAAPLTDLFDPTLAGAVSPHSGQVARSTSSRASDQQIVTGPDRDEG